MSYQSASPYATWLTDKQVMEKVRKIMNSFVIPKERWKKLYTEGEYVELTSERPMGTPEKEWKKQLEEQISAFYLARQYPPNFIKQVRLPPGVKPTGRIKPHHRLTFEEQLLIQKYYPFKLHPRDKLQLWKSDLLLTVFFCADAKVLARQQQNRA